MDTTSWASFARQKWGEQLGYKLFGATNCERRRREATLGGSGGMTTPPPPHPPPPPLRPRPPNPTPTKGFKK